VTAGLGEAARELGTLSDREVLVVGAGSMSALAATVASQSGAGSVVVANRTLGHAQRLAASVGGRATDLEHLEEALVAADLVISCTGAVGHVIEAATVTAAQRRRNGRPLVLLDLALPRDVEPAVHEIDGVSVVDLESLAHTLVDTELAADVEATREIVAHEVAAFLGWQRASSVAPTVVALRGMAEDVVVAELIRLAGRAPAGSSTSCCTRRPCG